KLIRNPIELEPLDLDDERPRRRRAPDDDERRGDREDRAGREVRQGRADGRPRGDAGPLPAGRAARSAPADPIFDRPYEAAAEATPAWEEAAKERATAAAPAVRSPNIRARKKVAALLGGQSRAAGPGGRGLPAQLAGRW